MARTEIEPGVWINPNHPSPARKAPVSEVGFIGWLRTNLFSSVGNTILTIISATVLYWVVSSTVEWVFFEAFWTPIWLNRKLFATGTYPPDHLWQPSLVLMLVSLLFGLSAGRWGSIVRNLAVGVAALLLLLAILPLGINAQLVMAGSLALLIVGYIVGLRFAVSSRLLAGAWLLSIPLTLILLKGGVEIQSLGFAWTFATELVGPGLYGGLMLTILLTVVGITFSFPLGVALALGRRSSLPVVKYACIAYIETIRGVPLITLLFMSMVMLPLFLPSGMPNPPGVTRVMVAITLFSAAYLAENVRGGLQAIPKGQWEAADALGLRHTQKLRMIILPQALRAVIPAIVGQFIGLFKDTSLVALVGLADLLGIGKSVIQQPDWLKVQGGITREVYLFVAVVYFIFSYGMSWASRQLETQLGVGTR